MRGLQVPVVDHAPAAVDVGDEAGRDVAGLGHRGHDGQSTIRPLRGPPPYRGRPVDDQADDEGPRQAPKLTELEAARAYTATRQHDVLEALMSQDAPDVDAVLGKGL